jgi:anti-anti-sigma regulatory factor
VCDSRSSAASDRPQGVVCDIVQIFRPPLRCCFRLRFLVIPTGASGRLAAAWQGTPRSLVVGWDRASVVEYRRDFLDVLLGPLDVGERPRVLAQLGAENARQGLIIRHRGFGPSGTVVGIFTSHRDRVTTIHLLSPAGVAAPTFQAALDHGMHAGQPLLVVDLGEVPSLGEAALAVLVDTASRAALRGSRITARGAQPAVFQEFLAAGLVVTLDVHPAYQEPAIINQQGKT